MKHILAATAELAGLLHRWQVAPTKELTVELLKTLEQAGVVPMTIPEGVEVEVPPPRHFISCSVSGSADEPTPGCHAEMLPVQSSARPLHCNIDMFGINTPPWSCDDGDN